MDQIWRKICTHFDVPEQVANTWYSRILEQLDTRNPARAYHNWREMMLRKQADLNKCKPSIALAAFFQYYHFDGNRSCVRENCEVFEEFCCDAMIEDENLKSLVVNLLGQRQPDYVSVPCYDDEENLLQDIDLAILAAPTVEYERYTTLLRSEYAQLNEDTYKYMRLKVLETLLLIPAIFATPEYHQKYEAAARANIKNEVDILKQNSEA